MTAGRSGSPTSLAPVVATRDEAEKTLKVVLEDEPEWANILEVVALERVALSIEDDTCHCSTRCTVS